jgi:hypothetical protein
MLANSLKYHEILNVEKMFLSYQGKGVWHDGLQLVSLHSAHRKEKEKDEF